MARGVNKVILIGNLGDEPLCRSTHSGCSVTNISMVTNEVRRNIDTGETTEFPEWHRVVMWGKLADIAKQYLHKGSQIYVEGKLRTRTFQDKQGVKRSVTEIVADEMQMLGSRPSTAGMGSGMQNQRRSMNSGFNQGMGGMYNNQDHPTLTNPYQNSNSFNQNHNNYGNSMNSMQGMGSSMGGYGNDNMSSNIYNNMDNDMPSDLGDDMMGSNQENMGMMSDSNRAPQAPVLTGQTQDKDGNKEPSLNDEIPF